MADRIDQLKIGNTSYDIALPADSKDTMFYTTASSTANAFTVTIPDLVSLYDGAIINVKFNAATAANCTLNVNSLGAKRIEYRVGTWCTTHISANMYITLVYNASGNSNAGTWVMQGAYYSDSNTATAADNILDGSNSGTQITYAPYTSQQSKLSFDTSTTNPARTDRLNLNGHLHTTRLSLSDAVPVVFSIVPNGSSSVSGVYNCSLPVSVFNALYNYIGTGKTVFQNYYGGDGGSMYISVHTATWTIAPSPAGSTYQSIACCTTVPYFYLVKLSDSQIGVYSYASSTPLKVFMAGTDSTLYGYLINRTIDTTEVTNIDNINSIINLVKSVDSTVVHKGGSGTGPNETIFGTKTFYQSIIASVSSGSGPGSTLGNDGTLTLKKGSGTDSPAYIDFTGTSGNAGTVRLKSTSLSSGTKTVTIPAEDGTLLTDASLEADYFSHLVVSTCTESNKATSDRLPYVSLLMVETCTVASYAPTAGGSTLTQAFTGSLGSGTTPFYISGGHLYPCNTYAGGTRLCINGNTYTSTDTIYVATNAPSTTNYKRYLLGSYSTTALTSTNTNANCYMSNGNIYATAFYASSDARLKDNIGDPELDYLEIIDKINLREFTWKNDKEKNYNIGIIAQELKEILPERYSKEFVGEPESDDDYFAIGENKFIYLALGAIKDQQKEINELKEQVSKLELK